MASDQAARPRTAAVDCGTDRRRAAVRRSHHNGVDGVETSDDGLSLTVTFLGRAPAQLAPENIRIDGGRRIRDISAVAVRVETQSDPALDDRAHITLDRAGDTSTYTLGIVQPDAHGRPGTDPYPGFDPRYHRADFTFRPACPSLVDCAETPPCPPEVFGQPAVNHTARDYASLRRLLLDRMTLTVPDWVERHAPDLGVTLVELLAYVGDQLSYHQDAVATEAYLDTARRRVSVRRHARLVDYHMHDGCNARAFVHLRTCAKLTLAAGDFRFVAVDVSHLDPVQRPELGPVISDEDLEQLPSTVAFEVFEPVSAAPVTLYPAHNAISFWTWGNEECALPSGATAATLRDEWVDLHDDAAKSSTSDSSARRPRRRALRLAPGDVLIIEEVRGPRTGAEADADPTHRQAVRLTSVTRGVDELYDQPVVDVTWAAEDALTFPVCLSSRGGPDCCLIEDVSLARGNVVLVDHGRSLTACGAMPEVLPVPADPVTPPSCAPPEFGCPDRAATDPAVALVNALIAATAAREPLRPDDVRQLADLLGAAAVSRAGLVVTLDTPTTDVEREIVLPATTEEQTAALRTLLDQVSYPAVAEPFRPTLRFGPVTQQVPFPRPQHVAANQARLLATIPDRVSARLAELWRQVSGGRALSKAQVAELAVLFGGAILARLRLTERPVTALRELLARRAELLAAKHQRLAVLIARARSGVVLGSGIGWEVAHSWGADYAAGLDPDSPTLAGSARAALDTDPRDALPAVELADWLDENEVLLWRPRRDLLASGPRQRHFVGEVEDDPAGVARLTLRFGDGRHGARPPAGRTLEASYRVGNGTAGNVGAEAINHLVLCCGVEPGGVTAVRNPLAATGGTDPEPLDQVRQLAPLAPRRTLLRAVTAADYAALAATTPGVRRAAAEIRWTGSGQLVHVCVDPVGQARPDQDLLDAVADALEPVRRIGHDVRVGPARLVPLDIELTGCVAAGYQRAHVLAALRAVFGTGVLADGRLGLFHPDALDFGAPVRVSRLVAAAAAVPGVVTARVTRLRRQFGPAGSALDDGLLPLGPLEIAQLDNDPDQPENGRLSIVLGGGR